MSKKDYIVVKHTNATTVKLPNKRVTVIDHDDSIHLEFKIIDLEDSEPKAFHDRIYNKLTITTLKLSKEGAEALMWALMRELKITKSSPLLMTNLSK